MSSTPMYQGLEGDKNTSRVLRPPGGGSSNIFGTDPAPTAPIQRGVKKPQDSNIFGSCSGPSTPPSKKENIPAQTPETSADVKANDNPVPEEKPAESPKAKADDDIEEDDKEKEGDNNNDQKPEEDTNPFMAAQANQRRNQQAMNPITGLQMGASYETTGQGDQNAPQGIGSYNPITGAANVQEVHTSTRVRQPPGGASSKLW